MKRKMRMDLNLSRFTGVMLALASNIASDRFTHGAAPVLCPDRFQCSTARFGRPRRYGLAPPTGRSSVKW